ncbi:MAG: glycerol-3-phosphate acyltransferase [Lachnospiraceae bacterium]|nr:glycerol-3-phosphate acyltransferase [Lachnospiraceae bacterium]MBP1585749.1 glycerol-3-phosphate acyltransferase [Lachnospiraceae bacterium]
MARLWCFLIGYVFGLVQTAFIVGKCKGVDIRNYGSGNSGTTNALRVLGTKAGLIVFAGDMLKAIITTVIIRLTFGNMYPEIKYLLIMYGGAGCVLAHDFPFYMKFKGGKGIAATGGMILAFHGSFLVTGLAFFFVPFLLTHYVSLGSLILYAGFIIQLVISGQFNLFGMFDGMSQAALNEMYIIALFLMILAYWQHRSNILRLIRHEERKTYLGKKNDANLPDTGAKK